MGVADTRSVKRSIKRLQRVRTWQLVVVLFLMLFVSATFLRLNNIGMVQRREAVIVADKEGDTQTIQNRLADLRAYVSAHMNTGGNSVYLVEEYARHKAVRVQQAVQANVSDKEVINKKVDDICKPQYSGYNQGYVDCFAREYAKYAPGKDPISSIKPPDTELYRADFVAPLWSPDFAGFSVVICVLLLLVIIGRIISIIILKILLKIKYQDI